MWIVCPIEDYTLLSCELKRTFNGPNTINNTADGFSLQIKLKSVL